MAGSKPTKTKPKEKTGLSRQTIQNNQVITRLVQRTNSMTRKDIKNWIDARNQALNIDTPRRLSLYNLYDSLILDNQFLAVFGDRKRDVTGHDFNIVDAKTKQPNEELKDLFKKKWFREFLKLSIDSLAYGHSLIQFTKIENGEVKLVELVPRRHVYPEFGAYTIHQSDMNYIPYRDTELMDYLIEVGGDRDLGILDSIAPQILWKKNAEAAWSEYCEMFGQPLRVGKTNTRSTADLDRMDTNLKNMGSAAYIVVQDGESIEFVESTKGDAYKVYDAKIAKCDAQISKRIQSQTMTTDNGSSRSQSEVHERVAEKVEKDDLTEMQYLINDKLFPLLIKHGYKLENCLFEWSESKTITKDEFDRDMALDERFDIEDQYFIEKYGVPIKARKTKAQDTPPLPGPKTQKKGNKLEAKLRANETIAMHLDIHSLYEDDKCCK